MRTIQRLEQELAQPTFGIRPHWIPQRSNNDVTGAAVNAGQTLDSPNPSAEINTPEKCPNCAGRVEISFIEYAVNGWIESMPGPWDCTAHCYRADPKGFREALQAWNAGLATP